MAVRRPAYTHPVTVTNMAAVSYCWLGRETRRELCWSCKRALGGVAPSGLPWGSHTTSKWLVYKLAPRSRQPPLLFRDRRCQCP